MSKLIAVKKQLKIWYEDFVVLAWIAFFIALFATPFYLLGYIAGKAG